MSYPITEFLKNHPDPNKHSLSSKSAFYDLMKASDPQALESRVREIVSALSTTKGRWVCQKISPRRPLKFSNKAAKYTETAVQRAIYDYNGKGEVDIQKDRIVWMDCECPVDYVDGKARRTCPDLIGWSPVGAVTWVVDLKYAPNRGSEGEERNPYYGDTPLYACIKSLYYAIAAYQNRKNLRQHKMFHSECRAQTTDDFLKNAYESIQVLVAANSEYWTRWNKALETHSSLRQISDLQGAINKCLTELNAADVKLNGFAFVDIGVPNIKLGNSWKPFSSPSTAAPPKSVGMRLS